MEAFVADWLSLAMRWLHLITGIAWIGASFYFVWLDNHLEPYAGPNPRIHGELWSLHGGGFYHNQKYLLGPERLPETLHWFKWEAYSTWLSGAGLLAIVYWYGANTYLIDRSVADISAPGAILISASSMVLGWVVYDILCRSISEDAVLGAVIFVLLAAAAYGFSKIFGARAAYIHVGAMIGTIMVWSVFFIIVPGQAKMVAAIEAGQTPDPEWGRAAKQRSVHNNYFTLPVLFIMISNHYPMTYGNKYAWLVLAVISLAGVLIRHFFNLRHKGNVVPALPLAAIAMLVLLAYAIAPRPPEASAAGAPRAGFAEVQAAIGLRCVSCHAEKPTQPGIAQAPAGVMLDKPERILAVTERIRKQVVETNAMPIGNLTQMTPQERALIGRWIAEGAKPE